MRHAHLSQLALQRHECASFETGRKLTVFVVQMIRVPQLVPIGAVFDLRRPVLLFGTPEEQDIGA